VLPDSVPDSPAKSRPMVVVGLPSLLDATKQTADVKSMDQIVMTDRSIFFYIQRNLFGTTSDPPSLIPQSRVPSSLKIPLFSLKNKPTVHPALKGLRFSSHFYRCSIIYIFCLITLFHYHFFLFTGSSMPASVDASALLPVSSSDWSTLVSSVPSGSVPAITYTKAETNLKASAGSSNLSQLRSWLADGFKLVVSLSLPAPPSRPLPLSQNLDFEKLEQTLDITRRAFADLEASRSQLLEAYADLRRKNQRLNDINANLELDLDASVVREAELKKESSLFHEKLSSLQLSHSRELSTLGDTIAQKDQQFKLFPKNKLV